MSAPQSGANATDVPLTVEDGVRAFRRTAPLPQSGTDPSSSVAQRTADVVDAFLPLPQAVAREHRVQLSIRGRRYETTMGVATTYCLTFSVFFHAPLSIPNVPSVPMRTVGDVAVEQAAANGDQDGVARPSLSEAALMAHYLEQVEPVLQAYVTQCAPHSGGAAEGSEPDDLPPFPRPAHIRYDAASHVWKFEFSPRLTESEEEAERARRRRLAVAATSDRNAESTANTTKAVSALAATAAASAERHITSDEINASPFLLLQNDYMGLLLVYLRRCAKVRAEREHQQQHQPSTSYPTLPLRWAEMNYDEQVSFLQLLRALGVMPLLSLYARPTAAVSTSQYVGADAAWTAAQAKAEGEACSLRARAEDFMRHQQAAAEEAKKAEQPAESTAEVGHRNRGDDDNGHDNDDDDDDDGLVLAAKGCARCGMAGHATEECPY